MFEVDFPICTDHWKVQYLMEERSLSDHDENRMCMYWWNDNSVLEVRNQERGEAEVRFFRHSS